jgi:hypothetical protein
MRRWFLRLLPGALGLALWAGLAAPAPAQQYEMNRFFYYPYYYWPWNYWPIQGPKYPEPVGTPYVRPPAYMQMPPFKEPMWHHEYWYPGSYYRGFHFLLDVF